MDVSISLTKVWGRHTIKTGFYNQYSNKQQVQGGAAGGPGLNFQQDTVGTNPCDTSFGFANAAIGCFSSYSQGSKGVEGEYIYYNTEGYVQDNWKVNRKLTLDYGVRLVHQTPQYDARGQASNFFTDQWDRSAAPVLYVAGCANGVYPCTGTNRQAMNPLTGQFLGPNTTLAIGTIVPNTGNLTNGLVQAGQGIPISTYLQPALGVAPRFGMAYDVTGRQQIVLRGGGGLYFDRPSRQRGVRAGPEPAGAKERHAPLRPAADARHRRSGHRSAVVAVGLRVRQPAAVVDAVERRRRRWRCRGAPCSTCRTSASTATTSSRRINLNDVDFGTAFLPQNQDPTLTPTTPGATSLSTDQMRAFRGYSAITQNVSRGWVTHHSLQLSFKRRFRNGLSFGFNDTIGLSSVGSTGARLQHNADGTVTYPGRPGGGRRLLQTPPMRHTMKGNFVWDLPDLHAPGRGAARARPGHQRLAVVGRLDRVDGQSVHGRLQLPERRRQREPDRISGLRRAHPHRRRSRAPAAADDLYRQFNTAAFQGRWSAASDSSRATTTSAAALRRRSTCRSRGTSGCPAAGPSSSAPTCSTPPTAPASPAGTRRCSSTRPRTRSPTSSRCSIPVTGLLNDGVNLTSTGAVSPNRSQPKNAGFGVANGYQAPRNVQLQSPVLVLSVVYHRGAGPVASFPLLRHCLSVGSRSQHDAHRSLH